jgi:hypothetical protein
MKGSADVATMNPDCSRHTLSCAGGNRARVRPLRGPDRDRRLPRQGYSFDKAITKFAFAYADQNDSDYKAFGDSIDNGQITAEKD